MRNNEKKAVEQYRGLLYECLLPRIISALAKFEIERCISPTVRTEIQHKSPAVMPLTLLDIIVSTDRGWDALNSFLCNNDHERLSEKLQIAAGYTIPLQQPDPSPHERTSQSSAESICCTPIQSNSWSTLVVKLKAVQYWPGRLSANDVVQLSDHHAHLPILRLVKAILQMDHTILLENAYISLDSKSISANNDRKDTWDCTTADQNNQESLNDVVHPSDAVLFMIKCCNRSLQQDIVCRLVKCQIAVPLIIPVPIGAPETSTRVEFSMWPLEKIALAWKPLTSEASKVTALVETPGVLVSFLRVGYTALSKSRIASRVISGGKDDDHPYFMPSEKLKKLVLKTISVGIVEMFWNVPAGDMQDSFPLPVFALNLHGCCVSNALQKDILLDRSHVIVLFLSDGFEQHKPACNILNNVANCQAYRIIFVCTFSIDTNSFETLKSFIECHENLKQRSSFLSCKAKNAEEISDFIRQAINSTIQKSCFEAETLAVLAKKTIQKHSSVYCNDTTDMGQYSGLERLLTTSPKSEMLQLQLLLAPIVATEKETRRMRQAAGQNREAYIQNLQNRQLQHKKTQLKHFEKLMAATDSFLFVLLQTIQTSFRSDNDQVPLIRWMASVIEKRMRACLPQLRSKYATLRTEALRLHSAGSAANEYEEQQKRIADVLDEIQSQSVGIEHIMRELAQIYMLAKDYRCAFEWAPLLISMPRIHARMLLSCIPLELMNGDCGYVDIRWIQAVLKETVKELGADHNICAVSIIGIQSSGKSTLLNTMFGVNFAVSSGRCTKGIYAQLIPITGPYATRLGCSHLLVLDTEGLRAPELKTNKEGTGDDYLRDNELATFVVGLADLTIINIMGETAAEMHDTLQIAVHAMLRMKKIDSNPMCVLVHQNVHDSQALENTAQGREAMQRLLDTVTREAAASEGLYDAITRFTDVIKFDFSDPNYVWYLPSLFNGRHINPRYAAKVQQLWSTIVAQLETKKANFTALSKVPQKVEQLWSAILDEDFVFSFKNAREIRAFNVLQNKMDEWRCSISRSCSDWISNAKNQIRSCRTNTQQLEESLQTEFNRAVSQVFQSIVDEKFEQFFLQSEYNVQLVNWHALSYNTLFAHCEEQRQKCWCVCLDQIYRKKTEIEVQRNMSVYELKLKRLAKAKLESDTRHCLKNDSPIGEVELKKEYEKFWKDMTKQIVDDLGIKRPTKIDVEHLVLQAVEHSGLVGPHAQRELNYMMRSPVADVQDMDLRRYAYSVGKKWFKFPNLTEKQMTNITNATAGWISFIENQLNDMKTQAQEVTLGRAVFICKSVADDVNKFCESEKIQFNHGYYAWLACVFYDRARASFEAQQEKFIMLNDPMIHLETEWKPTYWKFFQAQYNLLNAQQVAVETIVRSIVIAVVKAVEEKLPDTIADYLVRSGTKFPNSKFALMAQVLLTLGERIEAATNRESHTAQNFSSHEMKDDVLQDYKKFFDSPVAYMKEFLILFAKKSYDVCSEAIRDLVGEQQVMYHRSIENAILNSAYTNTSNHWFELLEDKINAMHTITVHFVNELRKLRDLWIEEQESFISKHLSEDEVQQMRCSILELLKTNLKAAKASINVADFMEAGKRILDGYIAVGCRERCPLCGVLCDLSVVDHPVDHMSTQHWPSCLTGWTWNDTNKMVVDICTTKVATDRRFRNRDAPNWHPYKRYREVYPKWSISPDISLQASLYWKWFCAQYNAALATLYKCEKGKIPRVWSQVTWHDARSFLEKEYNVSLDTMGKEI